MWWCPFCQKRTYLPESINVPEIATSVEDWPIEMREKQVLQLITSCPMILPRTQPRLPVDLLFCN